MQLVPVLDLKGGVVVRGVGGQRAEYRPIVSRWTDSARPLDVAEALRRQFGLSLFYLADLDAIAGAEPALPLYAELRSHGFALWVDAGVHDAEAGPLLDAGIEGVVLGLETVNGPDVLGRVVRRAGADRVVFSLDLQDGRPLGNVSAWREADAIGIAAEAIGRGVARLIVLDLTRVGLGGGTGTEHLCRQLAIAFPGVELIAGGGVRDTADLGRLEQVGVHRVLVASALHDGRILPPGERGR